jgi:predicted DNA-binding protein
VRFPAERIEQVKRLADADGMTVSAWIRRAVERAVRRQGVADVEQIEDGDAACAVVERLQRDVADLAAALAGSDPPRVQRRS